MTKVLATGVFNVLHPGHLFYLNESKKLGDELIVIVSSNILARKILKKSVLPQEQRAEMVGALKMVDKVFVGDDDDIFKLLPVIKPDVIALGHDQDVDEKWLEDELVVHGINAKIVRIRNKLDGRYYSTTNILKELKI
jgi:FAD synthetase